MQSKKGLWFVTSFTLVAVSVGIWALFSGLSERRDSRKVEWYEASAKIAVHPQTSLPPGGMYLLKVGERVEMQPIKGRMIVFHPDRTGMKWKLHDHEGRIIKLPDKDGKLVEEVDDLPNNLAGYDPSFLSFRSTEQNKQWEVERLFRKDAHKLN